MRINNELIRDRRQSRGLSMRRAAEASGLGSAQHWYQVESGKAQEITAFKLARIAKTLRISMAKLICDQ